MEIHVHKEQKKYSEMIPYNWMKGPAVQKLYRKPKESLFRQPYFRKNQNFKVPHLGLGSAVHISSPGLPLSSVLKSMSTNDDPTSLEEFDSEFLKKALHKKLTYLELRKVGFMCQKFPNIMDTFNKSAVEFTISNLPWVIKIMPERYPWMIYGNMHEKERQLKECICAQNWRSTMGQKQECLALQKSPWT